MILPQQKDSAIAFRMTGFIYGDQKGIRLVTNEQTKSLLLLLQPEFDIGGCIKSQKFVATHDGVYHFDAKVNLLYSIEDRTYRSKLFLYCPTRAITTTYAGIKYNCFSAKGRCGLFMV